MITVHKAKSTLSQLIARALAGEEIVIARGPVPAVRLVPVEDAPARPVFGRYKGKIRVDPRFFAPMSEAELRRWEGRD